MTSSGQLVKRAPPSLRSSASAMIERAALRVPRNSMLKAGTTSRRVGASAPSSSATTPAPAKPPLRSRRSPQQSRAVNAIGWRSLAASARC
jgi:hypothetical protein